jgi:hypothetical protein
MALTDALLAFIHEPECTLFAFLSPSIYGILYRGMTVEIKALAPLGITAIIPAIKYSQPEGSYEQQLAGA